MDWKSKRVWLGLLAGMIAAVLPVFPRGSWLQALVPVGLAMTVAGVKGARQNIIVATITGLLVGVLNILRAWDAFAAQSVGGMAVSVLLSLLVYGGGGAVVGFVSGWIERVWAGKTGIQ